MVSVAKQLHLACRNDEVAEHLGLSAGKGKKRKGKNKRRLAIAMLTDVSQTSAGSHFSCVQTK